MTKLQLHAREGVAFDRELVVRDTTGATVDITGWIFALTLQRQAGVVDVTLGMATGGAEGMEVVDGPNGALRLVVAKTTLEAIADTTGNFLMWGDLLGTPPAGQEKFVADVRLAVSTPGNAFEGSTHDVIVEAVGAAIFLRAQAEADRAELNAGYTEEFLQGISYASQAAGEAATTAGQFFRVPIGTVPETYTRYQRTATGSVVAAPLASTSDLASSAAGKGANLVGSDDGAGGTLWTTVAGFVSHLLSSAGSAVIGFIQAGVDAVARPIQEKLRESVSVFDYMTAAEKAQVIAGGTALDLSASLAKAFAQAQALGAELVWPSGLYAYTVSPNWAWNQCKHRAIGTVRLRNIGTGHAVVFDGGAAGTGPGLFGCRAVGRFVVEGVYNSQDGVWIRAIHHGDLEFYVRGAGTAYAGWRVLFAVCTVFRGATTPNEEGWFTEGANVARPQSGLILNIRGAGEFVSYCFFPNFLAEAVSGIGIQLLGTLGNVFMGGTSEGCESYGLFANAGAHQDRVIGMDFEVNTTADAYLVNASAVALLDCDSDLSIVIGSGCKKCRVVGGLHQTVLIDSGALRSVARDLVFNRLGTSGTFTDAGTSSTVRSVTDSLGNIWGVGTAAFGGSAIAAGARATVVVPVTGAKVGDGVDLTFSNPTTSMDINGHVYAAGFALAIVTNITGASITPASGTMTAKIRRGT